MTLFEYKLELFGTFSIAGVEEVTGISPVTARYSNTARNEVTRQSHPILPTAFLVFYIAILLMRAEEYVIATPAFGRLAMTKREKQV